MLNVNVSRISNAVLHYIPYTLIQNIVTFWYKQKCLNGLSQEKAGGTMWQTGSLLF